MPLVVEPGLPRPGLLARVLGTVLDREWTPAVFFGLTVASVFYVGTVEAAQYYELLGQTVSSTSAAVLAQAAIYTAALIAILGTHELGHYLVARAQGVKTSLPIFIPVPFGLGTFGAVIAMNELPRDRRTLLRIGAAGPIAGGVVALILMYFALPTCPPSPPLAPDTFPDGLQMLLGDSLGMRIIEHFHGTHVIDSPNMLASPFFKAAWTGFLLTSINLFPIGQLDGGHVAYAIFGSVMNRLARPLSLAVMALALFGSPTYIFWGLLVRLMASWHPPVPAPEDRLPLDAWILAGACAILFALTFMVAPILVPEIFPGVL